VQSDSLQNASFSHNQIGNNLKTIISHFGEKFMMSMRKIDRIRSLYYDDGMSMTDVARRLNCSIIFDKH